jgi:hypothetical protein
MQQDSIKNLALSIICLVCIVICGDYEHRSSGSVAAAVRWAATTILLGTFYYYIVWSVYKCWCLGEQCERLSGYNGVQSRNTLDLSDMDIDSIPESIDEDPEPRSRTVTSFSPELTIYSVWVYVYGWGVLLFVCMYSLPGVNVSSSCWWMLGMLVTCIDEMILNRIERLWICFTILGLTASVSSLLVAVSDTNSLLTLAPSGEGYILGNFTVGVLYPIVAPCIFFSIRSYRNTGKDLSRLFELATPFMVTVSICILFGMQNPIQRRRLDNSTTLLETHANFDDKQHEHSYLHSMAILFSPLAAIGCVRTLINSVMSGHATEFIAAFTAILATRTAAAKEFQPLPLLAFVLSAVCFFVVVIVKQF